MSKQPNAESNANQGEGNRKADREYREAATKHAQSGRVEKAAREAEEALDGDEADELEEAEEEGKAHASSTHDQRGEED